MWKSRLVMSSQWTSRLYEVHDGPGSVQYLRFCVSASPEFQNVFGTSHFQKINVQLIFGSRSVYLTRENLEYHDVSMKVMWLFRILMWLKTLRFFSFFLNATWWPMMVSENAEKVSCRPPGWVPVCQNMKIFPRFNGETLISPYLSPWSCLWLFP